MSEQTAYYRDLGGFALICLVLYSALGYAAYQVFA